MLHPIKTLDHVIEEYRDYLLTEFSAKDRALKKALESELDKPGFLCTEPFFQAHRPFRPGKRWSDLPIDAKLANVMKKRTHSDTCYIHQSGSISHLMSDNASATVITTGTGSGKTECFLLPVMQNAIEDAVSFKKNGLTAILLYPMNALANDQEQRISEYLEESGFSGVIRIAKYDRSTTQAQREELRKNPPHIILTNYMMLEYLLVRPADRESIFANHRCKYLVLDEVHTYRGTLGSNIALLVRRLKAHLSQAKQDWNTNVSDEDQRKRYPKLITVGASATIKSVDEEGKSREEIRKIRDEAVQEFFSKLTGEKADTIHVYSEELQEIHTPENSSYTSNPPETVDVNLDDLGELKSVLCRLAGIDEAVELADAAKRCKILWDLNGLLIKKPMSLGQLVELVKESIEERKEWAIEDIRKEVNLALRVGASLPEEIPGALRLRVHRFIRGGWQFYRCVDPDCGKIYPKGEEKCECGKSTAPLYLCRSCGADYVRFTGNEDATNLRPSTQRGSDVNEFMLYQPDKFEMTSEYDDEEEMDGTASSRTKGFQPTQIKKRPVLYGSFDPDSLQYDDSEDTYPVKAVLLPARTRCMCCGGSAGSRAILTPVMLGTSAAVKVLSEGLVESLEEANKDNENYDGKDRLLIFSDSRQDAAHQARFIKFASRYDRMRRRVTRLLAQHGELGIQRIVELLGDLAVQQNDNPHIPFGASDWIHEEAQMRIRSWEEVPLLDELAVNADYRASIINLGLAGVKYHQLDEYVSKMGKDLMERFGLDEDHFYYLLRCLLDEIRRRGCLDRDMLRYHPLHSACPQHIKSAEWERRMKQPQGYPLSDDGEALPNIDSNRISSGIRVHNAWRKPKAGGQGPSLERMLKRMLDALGGATPSSDDMVSILEFYMHGQFIKPTELYGARQSHSLLQINSEIVKLRLTSEEYRFRCEVCGKVMAFASEGLPCPRCHGNLRIFSDAEVMESRWVRRIKKEAIPLLVADEHTAQVPNAERSDLEDDFKASASESPLNLLACSPTMEMGIDVGGLDAIILRNIPPRPDNYAQRGGRAGRRLRIGLVVGYARSTPHDQYFYDNPAEMIAGEVPAPALTLGNRDVILRHLNAIVFGAAEPGLAGKMVEYISAKGEIQQDKVDALIAGIKAQYKHSADLAVKAWGDDILPASGFTHEELLDRMESLPERVMDIFNKTSRQVIELRQELDRYYEELTGAKRGTRAGDLVARLLGIPTEKQQGSKDADDRSGGYPLRRFAEFGVLPGYEFPTEPASLRLLGDSNEESPISTSRRFGIGQFQPGANVYARAKRWEVRGLDKSSPWNPHGEDHGWPYRICQNCQLRFDADNPRCPRCNSDQPGNSIIGVEYAGFLAVRNESPVLDEEERYATRNLVRLHPQWDGEVIGRWSAGPDWRLRLSQEETVTWINEGLPPTEKDIDNEIPLLHREARGHVLCPDCGRILKFSEPIKTKSGGIKKARKKSAKRDDFGHASNCPNAGSEGKPIAIFCTGKVEILRLLAPLPESVDEQDIKIWGYSLGYSLLAGMKRLFAMDDRDLDFEFEGFWQMKEGDNSYNVACLTFIDPNIGGSGYLKKIAEDFDKIAASSIEHLNHEDCQSACYRCLKNYTNQRYHEFFEWPRIIGDLEMLVNSPVDLKPLETGDIDDPTPWLEAYKEGLGSPLELKFLRLFEKHGIKVQKQVPVAPSDDQPPISIADFVVEGKRIAIYIDGAKFHTGDRLRRDRYIREMLMNGDDPWKVVELKVKDLSRFDLISQKLSSS